MKQTNNEIIKEILDLKDLLRENKIKIPFTLRRLGRVKRKRLNGILGQLNKLAQDNFLSDHPIWFRTKYKKA